MKKKNVIAVLFMVLMIVIAIPTGMFRSIDKLRDDAAGTYYYDSTGYAVYQGLDTRMETAENLITVAERYVAQDTQLKARIDLVEYYIGMYNTNFDREADGFAQTVEANTGLTDAVQELYDELKEVDLSEKDRDYPDQLLALMKSEQDKIERSSYNDDARAFNDQIRKFPLSLVRGFGVEDMVTFDGSSSVDLVRAE